MNKLSSILLALLIFISGCINLPFDIFGKDIIDVRTTTIHEGVKDILILKNPESIPHSPLLPDQSFVFSFIIENKDNTKTANNVIVDLYNAPLFKDGKTNKLCNLYAQNKEQCISSDCTEYKKCSILPGEEKMISFELKTPSENEIVGIQTKSILNYKVSYDTEGSILYVVPVVNKEEIIKRQREGEKTRIDISKSHGSGPIEIDVELYGAPYILSGESATFLFKIRNRGSGTLEKDNAIQPDNFIIYFPAELVTESGIITPGSEVTTIFTGFLTNDNEDKKFFECMQEDNNIICKNKKEIPLYKDETRMSLRFEIPKVKNIIEPFKSYEIRAIVKYNYELRGSYDITINPFQNI